MTNFSINKKLFIVFFIISTLLIINILNSIYSITKTKNGFNQYRDTARSTVMLGRIQVNMLMVRINVKDYIKTNKQIDIDEYQFYYRKTLNFIEQTLMMIKDTDRSKEVLEIYNNLLIYNKNFEKVISLVNQRNNVVTHNLDVDGKIIEQELTLVMNSAESDKDLKASLSTAKAIRTLLLARLYTSKFLITNSKKDLSRAEKEFKILEKDIETIKKEIQNKHRIVHLGKAIILISKYINNVNSIRNIIINRNNIINENLNTIGPAIAKQAEEIKLSLKKEQDIIGPKMVEINNQLQNSTILLALVILLLFTVVASYISKNITKSLARLQDGLIQFFKYLNKESKDINQIYINSQDEFGSIATLINNNIQNTKEILTKEAITTQQIVEVLNTQPNIIFMTKGLKIEMANQSFLDFFDYESLEDFNAEDISICDFFIKEEGFYTHNGAINNWIKEVELISGICHVKMLDKSDTEDIFQMEVRELHDKDSYVITLSDITMTQKQSFEIQENQKLLLEQAKLVSMGEMIGNIAHQWRQPLSVISTGITGMQVQKEYGLLEDKEFNQICTVINDNTQYLSRTIDDFRNFVKGERIKKVFFLKDNINSFLHLVEGKLKSHNIKTILYLDEKIKINGYENEVIQCFMNIINNSRDALMEKKDDNRFIIITTEQQDNQAIIMIKDNGSGINEDILPKIFEPYFTTKHQSQGTGLGLHMTYNLIVDGMNGTIEACNIRDNHNGKDYKGTQFTISLPVI